MRAELPLSAREWGQAIFTHPLFLLLFGIGLALGSLVMWRKQTSSWQRRIRQEPTASAIVFYQEMVNALARAGHHRLPEQTPQEFADLVALPSVSAITQLYQQVRFGGKSLSETEIKQIEISLKELRTLERSKHNLSLS